MVPEDGIGHMTAEEAAACVSRGEAWAAERDGRVVALFGLIEHFPGRQADAWAIMIDAGVSHAAITRFARARIADSPLPRIQAAVDAECLSAVKWAHLCGLTAAHVMQAFGARSVPHILFERVKLPGSAGA